MKKLLQILATTPDELTACALFLVLLGAIVASMAL